MLWHHILLHLYFATALIAAHIDEACLKTRVHQIAFLFRSLKLRLEWSRKTETIFSTVQIFMFMKRESWLCNQTVIPLLSFKHYFVFSLLEAPNWSLEDLQIPNVKMRAVKMWTRLIWKFSRPYHKYDIFSFTNTWNAPRLVRENEGVLRIRSFFSFLYLKASCRQAILNKKKRSSGMLNAFWRWFLKIVGCYDHGPNNVYELRESLQIWILRLVKIKAYSGT